MPNKTLELRTDSYIPGKGAVIEYTITIAAVIPVEINIDKLITGTIIGYNPGACNIADGFGRRNS